MRWVGVCGNLSFLILTLRGIVLEKEIDRQGQQGVVFVFRVVAGHEQEQEQHQQVAGVEIRGQEIPEKGTGWLVFKTSVRLPW